LRLLRDTQKFGKWFEITERYTEVEDENGMTETQREEVKVYLYK